MARAVPCEVDDCAQQAQFLVTNLADGSSMSLCQAHWQGFVVALASELTAAATPEPEPEPEPPEPTRRRRRHDPEPSPDPEPVAAENVTDNTE